MGTGASAELLRFIGATVTVGSSRSSTTTSSPGSRRSWGPLARGRSREEREADPVRRGRAGGKPVSPELARRRIVSEERAPARWLHVLHGIFGAGRNWRSVVDRLVERRSDWGGLLVDLRLHGDSKGFEPPHTLEACVDDLTSLSEKEDLRPAGILGHSFGGKVALAWAARRPAGLETIWVVDSIPGRREPAGSAVQMLEALRELPGPFDDRGDAVEALERVGFDRAVGRWMSTNLAERDGAWTWSLDLEGMEALLDDFFRRDLWDVVEDPPGDVTVHFVRASASNVLGEEETDRIEEAGRRNGRVSLHRLRGGHWLNADNPEGMLNLLDEGLPR